LRFSSTGILRRQQPGLGVRARHIIPLLRTLAVVLLVVCLTRPEKGNEQTRIYAEGIAIQMVVDLSSSMESADFVLDGRRASRLDAVKNVFEKFVQGDQAELEGRPDDLVGLVGFARYPDSLAPLTLDHENVLAILKELETKGGPKVQQRLQQLDRAWRSARMRGDQRAMQQLQAEAKRINEEDATAIGDAIALAVERLRDLDRRTQQRPEAEQIKSKVMILLTDGEHNAGDLAPEQAAMLAKASDIKIYTIGIGAQRRGGALVDEKQIRSVAEITGGRFFQAKNTRALREVYAEIDELEKTETEERRFLQYTQAATTWVTLGGTRLPPLLMMVIVLLAVEVVLANTRFRRIP
jgi:Ca-activated chloride channel family protein